MNKQGTLEIDVEHLPERIVLKVNNSSFIFEDVSAIITNDIEEVTKETDKYRCHKPGKYQHLTLKARRER